MSNFKRLSKIKYTSTPIIQVLRELADAIEAAGVEKDLHLPDGENILARLSKVKCECCGSLRFDSLNALTNSLYGVRDEAVARGIA